MTVIRPNSVSGINSITVQSGNSLAVHKANGELIRTLTEQSGISTFSSISVGTAATDNSAAKSINIGLGASISQHSDNKLTFGTSGDPQVTIGETGNFGVGTENPAYKTHIQVTDTTAYSASTISANQFQLSIANGGASGVAGILFVTEPSSGNGGHCGIRALSTGSGDSALTFSTRGSATSAERLRITSTGLVGIGTDTPIEELHITASGYAGQVFQSARTTSTDNIGGPLWHDAGGNVKAKVQSTVAGDLKFTSGGSSEQARIDSNGNFGLGDTAPPNFTGYRTFSIHGSTGGAVVFGDDGTDEWEVYAGDGSLRIYDRANTQERIRITDNGEIGIGGANYGSSGQVLTSGGSGSAVSWTTVSGTTINNNANNRVITGSGSANTLEGESSFTYDGNGMVDIEGTGAAGIQIKSPNTTDVGVYFRTGSSNTGALTYLHTNNSMNFRVNSTNKMTITSSGNIGVGNSVGADFNLLDGVIVNTANGSAGVMINNSSSSHNAYLAFSYGSGAATSSNDQFSAYVGRVGDNTLIFGTDNTVRAQVNADGHFVPYANNTYDLGVDGTRWRNVYTNDLNLSNEGSTNSVDGTWGSYTIQEGENDLFLINKRNGKKYTFNLTEVV